MRGEMVFMLAGQWSVGGIFANQRREPCGRSVAVSKGVFLVVQFLVCWVRPEITNQETRHVAPNTVKMCIAPSC